MTYRRRSLLLSAFGALLWGTFTVYLVIDGSDPLGIALNAFNTGLFTMLAGAIWWMR